jgi:hypothetical protein
MSHQTWKQLAFSRFAPQYGVDCIRILFLFPFFIQYFLWQTKNMNTDGSNFTKTEIAFLLGLGLVAMVLIAIAVIPSLRGKIKEAFIYSGRDVIAKVSGKLTESGPQVTILKVKNNNVLNIEVFSSDEQGNLNLIARLPLFESRDGFFLLEGNATNLSLTDVNKDGSLEIIAPTYDDQMVPRLNIFRYQSDTGTFDRMNAPEDFKP